MKKAFFGLVAGLMSVTAFAQKVYNPGDFKEIKVFDRISVELIPGQFAKVEVDGSRSEDVEVINKNGELKVRMRTTKLLQGETVNARIYYKIVDEIQASEGATIGSSSPVKNYDLQVNVKSGGMINLEIDAEEIAASVSTGGSVKLTGKATRAVYNVSTGGDINANNLAVDRAKATVKAGGTIDLKAVDKVEARVVTGGTINVHGKPAEVDQKVTLGGSINIL